MKLEIHSGGRFHGYRKLVISNHANQKNNAVSFSNPSCDAGEPTFIIEQPNDPFCPVKLYCNINEFYGDLPKTGRFFRRVAPKKQIEVSFEYF
jgi:hypothetical protein